MANSVPEDLASLSDEELEALFDKTSKAALEAIKDNKRVSAEFNERATRKAAQAKYDAFTDSERAALAQSVSPVGIASQESVNNG